MLVLARKVEQVIRIGDDITLTIVEIRGESVRIGIDAPPNVAVHREEVYQAIQDAKPFEPLPGVAVPKSLGDMVQNRAMRKPDNGEDSAA